MSKVPPENVCRRCEKWGPAQDDRFCGWCGKPLFGLELTADVSRVFAPAATQSGKSGSLPPWDKSKARERALAVDGTGVTVGLRLKNVGQWPALVEISADKPWVVISDAAPMPSPDEEIALEAVIDVSQAPQSEVSKIVITAASEEARAEIEIDFISLLDITADLRPHKLYLDGGRETLTGHIVLKTGLLEPEGPESIFVDAPWARVRWLDPAGVSSTWLARAELPFELDIDKRILAERLISGNTAMAARLSVQDKNYGLLDNLHVNVEVRRPPIIDFPDIRRDEIRFRVLAGHSREEAVTVRNIGDEKLSIDKIELQVEGAAPWLSIDGRQKMLTTLGPSESTELILVADVARLELGNHSGILTIISNSFESAEKQLAISSLVYEEEYDGISAFDFGTTNSCVVKFDIDGSEAELVPLDKSRLKTVSSIILYEKLESIAKTDKTEAGEKREGNEKIADVEQLVDKRIYSVGSYAEAATADADAQESLVPSVKRDLGRPLTYPIRFFREPEKTRDLTPETVAGDIVAYLVATLEGRLAKKVTNCVITHPSRFSPVQLNSLRKAFEDQGLTVESMVHEPVGAALDFIINHEHHKDKYTVLVCDFGGGTTDFALLQVKDCLEEGKSGNKKRRISPEVLGTTACRHFGGDDVTEAVAQYFAKEGKILPEKEKNVPAGIYLSREEILRLRNKDDRKLALVNRETIRKFAEEAKIECAAKTDVKKKKAYEINIEPKPKQFLRFTCELDGETLKSLVYGEVLQAVDICRDLLATTLGEQALDYVLLAGRASQLPLVRKSFREAFAKPTKLVFAGQQKADEAPNSNKLKQCVARGAARFQKIKSISSPIEIDFAAMKPTATASIGILYSDLKGTPCFKPIIKIGESLGERRPIDKADVIGKQLIVYENVGNDNRLRITRNGRAVPNPDIRILEKFDFRKLSQDGPEQELKVEIELTPVHKVIIHINDKPQEAGDIFG